MTASQPNPFAELRDEVAASGNVLAVRMERLRDAVGKGRLGKWVVEEIDNRLRREGLGHTELSATDAWDEVLLYSMGSQVERLIEAAWSPSEQSAEILREATDNSAVDAVRQIRLILEAA